MRTRISRVASGGREFRVIRAERLSRHLYVHAGDFYYEILADLGAGLDLAAAWALAMRSPRSLVYLPLRSNRPPRDEPWRDGPLDVVFVHASMQFRAAAWKEVRARLGTGHAHTVELHGVDKEFQRLQDTDFEPTRDRDFRHHLRYATAAETLFVVGSGPAFAREGAWLRHFIEELPAAARNTAGAAGHQCVEIWPSIWKPGHTRRVGPGGLHLIYAPDGWPSGR
ncbi:MAG: hypothetical protein AUG49_09125 [Catenulispora sp. 13_1_20CM_3_70_7]|nr:MAG: hypothetical protein AUG49_09125 [Catenulispora sp. 13_1_20CM_3_70_7]